MKLSFYLALSAVLVSLVHSAPIASPRSGEHSRTGNWNMANGQFDEYHTMPYYGWPGNQMSIQGGRNGGWNNPQTGGWQGSPSGGYMNGAHGMPNGYFGNQMGYGNDWYEGYSGYHPNSNMGGYQGYHGYPSYQGYHGGFFLPYNYYPYGPMGNWYGNPGDVSHDHNDHSDHNDHNNHIDQNDEEDTTEPDNHMEHWPNVHNPRYGFFGNPHFGGMGFWSDIKETEKQLSPSGTPARPLISLPLTQAATEQTST